MTQGIENGNEVIAKFMELDKGADSPNVYFVNGYLHVPSMLQYHSSWDWLMPVVEKIEQGNYGFKMCRKVVEIYYDDTKEVILKVKEGSRKESLFKALTEFIKWYNQINSTTK